MCLHFCGCKPLRDLFIVSLSVRVFVCTARQWRHRAAQTSGSGRRRMARTDRANPNRASGGGSGVTSRTRANAHVQNAHKALSLGLTLKVGLTVPTLRTNPSNGPPISSSLTTAATPTSRSRLLFAALSLSLSAYCFWCWFPNALARYSPMQQRIARASSPSVVVPFTSVSRFWPYTLLRESRYLEIIR